MKHKLLLFLPFLLFITVPLLSQSVEVISKSSKSFGYSTNDFDIIEPKTDTTGFEFVATLKGIKKMDSTNTLSGLYNTMFYKAREFDANSYKVVSFSINDSSNEATLILDTYFANDPVLENNYYNHPKNVVFVIGSENQKKNKEFYFQC
jgi:hypothetical protein